MKKLGLIGGVGPESTVPYYRDIVYGVQKRVNKPYFPPLVIDSLSSFEVMGMSSAGKFEELTEYLLKGINNLAAAGAEVGALCCNTGHIVFDALQEKSPIPLISIVETTCREAENQGLKKVGLIGTEATMKDDYFKVPFRKANIDIIVPNLEEQKYIATKIFKELELGIMKEDTADQFIAIVDRMVKDDGIEAVVLGCTEMPLLFEVKKPNIQCLDTMALHINALIDAVMED